MLLLLLYSHSMARRKIDALCRRVYTNARSAPPNRSDLAGPAFPCSTRKNELIRALKNAGRARYNPLIADAIYIHASEPAVRPRDKSNFQRSLAVASLEFFVEINRRRAPSLRPRPPQPPALKHFLNGSLSLSLSSLFSLERAAISAKQLKCENERAARARFSARGFHARRFDKSDI